MKGTPIIGCAGGLMITAIVLFLLSRLVEALT